MKIGIIGLGSIGRRHLGNLLEMGEREIGVYDEDYEQRATIERAAHAVVTVFHQIEEFWSNLPEVVLICTPPESHIQYLYEARDNGVAGVFVEKPLYDRPLTLGKIPSAIKTMVACNMRYNNGPANIKRWLDGKALGDILSARFVAGYYLPDVRSDYKTCYAAKTGAILDVGSHAVDLATWLLGPGDLIGATVRGAETIGLPDTDGQAELLLRHDCGVTSSVFVSFMQPGYQQSIMVVGTKAQVTWWWAGQRCGLTIRKGWNKEALAEQRWIEDGSQMYQDEIADFLTCVREDKPTGNSLEEAMRTLDLLLEVKAGWASR